jgi:hypothetical protein
MPDGAKWVDGEGWVFQDETCGRPFHRTTAMGFCAGCGGGWKVRKPPPTIGVLTEQMKLMAAALVLVSDLVPERSAYGTEPQDKIWDAIKVAEAIVDA